MKNDMENKTANAANQQHGNIDDILAGEVWKTIKDSYFEVSNLGRVRNPRNGNNILKPIYDNNYPAVRIRMNDKTYARKGIHILVAEAFVPNPNGYEYVDHMDSNPMNYSASNLRWVKSYAENNSNENTKMKISERVREKIKKANKVAPSPRMKTILKNANINATPEDEFSLKEWGTLRYYTDIPYKGEEWRPVWGYNGLLEASNFGRVRKNSTPHHPGGIVKQYDRDGKYYAVEVPKLYKDPKHPNVWTLVHTLVMKAFVDNPDNLPIINHKSMDGHDNRLTNLEYCNNSYNSNCGGIKEKLSEMTKSRYNPWNYREHKKVVKYDMLGNYVETYDSVDDAAEKCSLKYNSLSQVLRNSKKSLFGFMFKYLDDVADADGNPVAKIESAAKSFINIYDKYGRFLAKYATPEAAGAALGTSKQSIIMLLSSKYSNYHKTYIVLKSDDPDDVSDIPVINDDIRQTFNPGSAALAYYDKATDSVKKNPNASEIVRNSYVKNQNDNVFKARMPKKKIILEQTIEQTPNGSEIIRSGVRNFVHLDTNGKATAKDYKVFKYGLDGKFKKEFKNADECAKEMGTDTKSIKKAAIMHAPLNDFQFRFLDEVKTPEDITPTSSGKVCACDPKNGKILKTFTNLDNAAEDGKQYSKNNLPMIKHYIKSCCDGKSKKFLGFAYKWFEDAISSKSTNNENRLF